jgi:hypothetical protein
MSLLRFILPGFFLTGFLFSIVGQELESETSIGTEFAYYFDDHSGYDGGQTGGFISPSYSPVDAPESFTPASGDEARTLGSGWGSAELQVYLKHKVTMPFMQGDGALTRDNALQFTTSLYVAPVAAYGKASVSFTPIAFLNLEAGSLLGTGWNAGLFNGLGLNTDGTPETTSFPGIVTNLWSSVTLQFDLAALIPGDWNHVVAVANGKIQYNYFSAAEDEEPWQWLADSGENFNGFQYKGTYFLGYQMPLVLDTVGFLVETVQHIGENSQMSTMDDNGWGSDFIKVTFGPLAAFSFNEHSSLTALFQFQTGCDYSDETIFNTYFINREYEGTYVKIYRVALAYSYTF